MLRTSCISGVVLSMFVLSKKLKISDPMVGFIGGLSQIGSSTLYAFTSTSVMIYAGTAEILTHFH